MNEAGCEPPEPLVMEPKSSQPSPFLQSVDWLSFSLTGALTLGIYLCAICPDIELGDSGIYATGGMYLGVPDVPGFPLWTMYSYLFTVLLPISNIAWRVNVASAVASAMTCAIVALLTSRCGRAILSDFPECRRLGPKQERKLLLACGCVAGLSLGLDTVFWNHALLALPWNFTLLLLVITITIFLRWQHAPGRTGWFHLACFAYGLTLTNSQALFAATVGFGGFILFTKPALARDVFAAAVIFLIALLAAEGFGLLSISVFKPVSCVQAEIAIGAFLIATVVAIRTRSLFKEWRTVLAGGLSFLLGLMPYLLVPIFSMANPPMNWGYPRTVDGFYHVISRGQYEALYPSDSMSRFIGCLAGYWGKTRSDFGIAYLFFALVPFIFFFRFQKQQRQWLLGLLTLFLSLSVFLVYLLNPSSDRAALELTGRFFPASHLVLSILAGCGLSLTGAFVSKTSSESSNVVTQEA